MTIQAQKKPDNKEYTQGIRIGYDLSRFGLYQFQPERKAYEISFDSEWKANYFAVVELGQESVKKTLTSESDVKITLYDYQSDGYYGRIGFDHNILRRDVGQRRDIVYTGVRYGFYRISQTTHNYTITDNFWGDLKGSVPKQSITGHWLELVFGAKVEIFKNLYVGGSTRLRFRLYAQESLNFPLAMPGYGDGSKKMNFGINYYISYQIPLRLVKAKETPKLSK